MFCKGDLLSLFKFNRKLCNIFDPSQKKIKIPFLVFPIIYVQQIHLVISDEI